MDFLVIEDKKKSGANSRKQSVSSSEYNKKYNNNNNGQATLHFVYLAIKKADANEKMKLNWASVEQRMVQEEEDEKIRLQQLK